jgi:hypothetical protein
MNLIQIILTCPGIKEKQPVIVDIGTSGQLQSILYLLLLISKIKGLVLLKMNPVVKKHFILIHSITNFPRECI